MNVCIVGHGPSTKGQGLGKLIDCHSLVIRHVECDWQDAEDYGQKYDIGIFCPDPISMARDSDRVPRMYWLYRPKSPPMEDTTIGDVWTTFREKSCRYLDDLVNPLISGRHFSRGTAAIIAASKILNPTEILLVGFDAVLRGEFSPNHHPPELSKMLNDKFRPDIKNTPLRFDTHEWAKEKELIKTISTKKNIRINALKQ